MLCTFSPIADTCNDTKITDNLLCTFAPFIDTLQRHLSPRFSQQCPYTPPPSLFPLVTRGDSGVPIVKKFDVSNILGGVVSWGTRLCGVGYPGVNSRVGYEEKYEWITDNVCAAANELPQWCPRTATLSTTPDSTTTNTTTTTIILSSLVSHPVGSGFPVTPPSTPLTTTTSSTKTTTTILPIIQICNEDHLKLFLGNYSSVSCAHIQSKSPSMQLRIYDGRNVPIYKTKCPYICINKCS